MLVTFCYYIGDIMENPFTLQPYVSRELFCDRDEESKNILSSLTNGRNITLISPRRYGKTGLIHKVFDDIHQKSPKITTCYCDIYSASSLEDFTRILSESIIKATEGGLIKKLFSLLSGARPLLSIDPITGSPQLSLSYENESSKKTTLNSFFSFLESQKRKFIIAIDEFQQVRNFKEKNMEALLRSYIQNLHNVRFIFCGSKKHIMTDMFTNANSPFYSSTQCVYLEKINRNIYREFIKRLFKQGKRFIDDTSLEFILDWTKVHTFYTQYLCNRIYDNGSKKIDIAEVKKACAQILEENRYGFLEIRNLITDAQWDFLKAIAKEGEVTRPSSGSFITKYKLGSSAAVLRIIESLKDKELILENLSLEGKSYSVYNVFMSRWMESL